jgi:hypothetical protein
MMGRDPSLSISAPARAKRRLGNLIGGADTVAFVLSPSSARSETCVWEVDEAARSTGASFRLSGDRWRAQTRHRACGTSTPSFFYAEPKVPGSGFGTGLASLIAALNTDFDWLRERDLPVSSRKTHMDSQ